MPARFFNLRSAAAALLLGFAAWPTIGCGGISSSNFAGSKITTPGSAAHVQGQIYGGQQPISGAQVAMYAASTSGYGLPSVSLLASPGYVTTDQYGNFNLTGTYNCPTNTDGSSALVYLVATGGNPGGGTNNAVGMMAALGSCAVLKANAATTFITINEVTTVASVFALSGFMSSATSVASSSTAASIQGLTNSFAATSMLANTSNGQAMARIPTLTATAPQAKVNTLANDLAACINSVGNTGAASPCGVLFANTTVNGVAPTDTLQAVLNIAHNPGQNVGAVFNLQTSTAPFAPALSMAPNDWTLALTYTGGGIAAPQAVAIDGNGAAWVASKANSVTVIGSNGSLPFGAAGYNIAGLDAPSSISIAPNGTVWVANCGNNCSGSGNASSLTQIAGGALLPVGTQFSGNGLSATYAVANDASGNVWAGNTFGNSVTELSSAGAAKSGTGGFTSGGFAYPVALALDTAGNAWVANPAGNNVVKLNSAGVAQSGTGGFTGSGLNYPYAVAIDASGNAWVANHGTSSVVVFNSTGAAQSGAAGYTGAGLNLPNSLALDGGGNAWAVNSNNSLSVLTASGAAISGSIGYTAGLNHGNGVAIDGSGNVWLTSCGSVCTGGANDAGSVVELIGAATPVLTPIAQGAATNKLAARP